MDCNIDTIPSMSEVVSALDRFLNAEEEESVKAYLWLTEMQMSMNGWIIADQLLHRTNIFDLYYLGAVTLRNIVLLTLSELDIEVVESIKYLITEHLSRIDYQTDVNVSNQLQLAMADLMIQMPNWKNPVQDLIRNFHNINMPVKLNVLNALPRAWSSRTHEISQELKTAFGKSLFFSGELVLEFLNLCFEEADTNGDHAKIIECCNTWLVEGFLSAEALRKGCIFVKAFRVLSETSRSGNFVEFFDLHKASADFMCDVTISAVMNDVAIFKTGRFCSRTIGIYKEPFMQFLSRGDYNIALNFTKLFVELARIELYILNSDLDVHNQANYKNILDVMMLVSFEMNSTLPFKFWNLLAEIFMTNKIQDPDYFFGSYIEQLIVALSRRCKIIDDCPGLLKDTDPVYIYRSHVSDLIDVWKSVFKKEIVFQAMHFLIQKPEAAWNDIEVSLFIIQKIIGSLRHNQEAISEIVEKLLTTWKDIHVTITLSTVKIFGELSKWFAENPKFLLSVMKFLVSQLFKAGLGNKAAASIVKIYKRCKEYQPLFVYILDYILQDADAPSITNGAVVKVLTELTNVINSFPDNHHAKSALETICNFTTQSLLRLIEEKDNDDGGDLVDNRKKDPVVWLNRLKTIFNTSRYTDSDLCNSVVLNILQILFRLMERFVKEKNVIKETEGVLQVIWKTMGNRNSTIVEQFTKKVAELYHIGGFSNFLDIAIILVDNYGTVSTCVPHLLKMFLSIVDSTEKVITEKNDIDDDHCDILEGFFHLSSLLLISNKFQHLQCKAFEKIVSFTISKISKPSRTLILIGTVSFVYNLITLALNNPFNTEITVFETDRLLIKNFLLQFGSELSVELFKFCSLSDDSQNYYIMVANVLFSMLDLDMKTVSEWYKNALDALPYKNSEVSKVSQDKLKQYICERITDKDRIGFFIGIERLRTTV